MCRSPLPLPPPLSPMCPAHGCALQSRTYLGMSTLRDLIFKRPARKFQYLHVLLDLSSHEKDKVWPREQEGAWVGVEGAVSP